MSKYCPLIKEKVLYTECLDCDAKTKSLCNHNLLHSGKNEEEKEKDDEQQNQNPFG